MKIHFDKAVVKPFHGIKEEEVKLVLSMIPDAWISDIVSIRFTNALDWNSPTWYDGLTKTLIVSSRGRKRRDIVTAMLAALAAKDLGFRGLKKMTKATSHQIDSTINPLIEQITELFPKPKPNPVYPAPIRHNPPQRI